MDSFRRFPRGVFAVAVIALLAVVAMPTAQSRSDGLVGVPAQPRALDDQFGAVAVRVPAFGGMYLADDTLVVHLTDPSQEGAAVGAIRAVFGAERIPAGGVRVLPATYGFAQLSAWHVRM